MREAVRVRSPKEVRRQAAVTVVVVLVSCVAGAGATEAAPCESLAALSLRDVRPAQLPGDRGCGELFLPLAPAYFDIPLKVSFCMPAPVWAM